MPSIDERLEAITQHLELVSHEMEQMHIKQVELDQRERKAREALLRGVAAYLEALGDKSAGDE